MTQRSHLFGPLIACSLLLGPSLAFAQFDDEDEEGGKEPTYSYFDIWFGQGEIGESPNEVDYEGLSFDWAHDFEDSAAFTWLSYDSYDAEDANGNDVANADIDFFSLGLGFHGALPLQMSWYAGGSYELSQFDTALARSTTAGTDRSSGIGLHAGLTGFVVTEKLTWHARIKHFDADGDDIIYRAGLVFAPTDHYAVQAEYLTFGDAEITGIRVGIRFILGVEDDDDW